MFVRPNLNEMKFGVVDACLSSQQAVWSLKFDGHSPGWSRKKVKSYLKNNRVKIATGMAEVVEYLPS
jgi:hypothetical protein